MRPLLQRMTLCGFFFFFLTQWAAGVSPSTRGNHSKIFTEVKTVHFSGILSI